MNKFQNKMIFFEYLKPENFSITLEPIDLRYVKRSRIVTKKTTSLVFVVKEKHATSYALGILIKFIMFWMSFLKGISKWTNSVQI